VSDVNNMSSMFSGAKLSTANYDDTLIGWSSKTLKPNVVFSGGNSTYCNSANARGSVINTYGWTIIDGGLDCSGLPPVLLDANGVTIKYVGTTVPSPYFIQASPRGTLEWFAIIDDNTKSNISNYAKNIQSGIDYFTPTGESIPIPFNNIVTTLVTDTSFMFTYSTSTNFSDTTLSFNQNISSWDVSNVTNMRGLFYNATSFNQSIGSWDVSNVTNMSAMFSGDTLSTANYDATLIGWSSKTLKPNVAFSGGNSTYCNSTNARGSIINTFGWTITDGGLDCSSLIILDANGVTLKYKDTSLPSPYFMQASPRGTLEWFAIVDDNTKSKITDYAKNINSGRDYFTPTGESTPIPFDNIVTTLVTTMDGMFKSSTAFNQPIGSWDVSNVNRMDGMFEGANSFNQPIDSWDVSSVTDMRSMFNRAAVFNQSIGSWIVRYVTNMSSMFSGASSFNQPIGSWDVSDVTNMSSMFSGASSFNQPIGSWDVSNVTSATGLFDGTDFNQDIISWNVERMTDMSNMFRNTPFNQDISSWNVSNVTNMSSMFRGTPFNQDISSWNVSKVTNMTAMFSSVDGNGSVVVEGKFNQDISSWDVSNVTSVNGLFHGTDFNQDISSWNVESMTDMSNMFRNTPFNQDISSWNVSNVTGMAGMFFGSSFNQDISGWCVPKITSQPSDFSNNSPLIINYKPVWGTCPEGSVDLYFSNLSNIPEKISLLSTSKVNNDIYITTGFIFKEPSQRLSYDFLFKYNTTSDSWSKISTNTSLEDLYYGNGEIINNKLYRFNGKTPDGLNSKLEIIDLQNLTVTLGQQNPLPRFLSGSSVNGIYIYVFGGETQQGYTNKLYRYNTETDTWLELPEMPESKQTKGEFVNNKLYVIGGFNGTPSNKIHIFNTSTNIWENEYTMPFNVSANALTVNNNYIYILGDYSDQDKIEVLDTNDMSFRFLKNNMIDRRHFDAEIINDKLYIVGGNTTSNLNSSLNSIQFSKINSTLSIDNQNFKDNLLFYPNPVDDKLFIQGLQKEAKVSIYNILGKLVLSKTTSSEIDVNNLKSGLYIIKITEIRGESVRKFIKK